MNDLKKSLNAWFKEEKFKQAYQDIGCSKEHLGLILIKMGMYSDNVLMRLWSDSHFQKICHNSSFTEDGLTKILIDLQIYFKCPLYLYTTEYDPDFFTNLSQDGIFKKICENSGYSSYQLADIVACGKRAQILCQRNQNETLTADKLDELKAVRQSLQEILPSLRTTRSLASPLDQDDLMHYSNEILKLLDDLPKNSYKSSKSAAMRGRPEWDAVLKSMYEYALQEGIKSVRLVSKLVQFVDPSWDVDERDLRKSLNAKKMQQEQDACYKKFQESL